MVSKKGELIGSLLVSPKQCPTGLRKTEKKRHEGWTSEREKTWNQIYIIPGTQMTCIFEGQLHKTRPKLQPKQGAPFGFQVIIYLYVNIY